MPLMKRSFVEKHAVLTEKEMLDYTAVAQSAPGAVAVNAAILVGMKTGGILGAAITLLATILPPLIIITAVALVYEAFSESIVISAVLRGMRAGICAVIADAVLSMISTVTKDFTKDSLFGWLRILIMPVSFVLAFVFKVNAAVIISVGAVLGVVTAALKWKKGGTK